MSDKNIIKTIDEMQRFADSREKLEWAEAMYRKLCAEEGGDGTGQRGKCA